MNCPKCGKPALPNAIFCKYCGGRLSRPVQPKPAAKICTACGAALVPQAKFCNICGTRAQEALRCASCGAALVPGSQFCNMCGARVGIAERGTPASRPAEVLMPQTEPAGPSQQEPIPEPVQNPLPETDPEPVSETVPEPMHDPETALSEPEPVPEPALPELSEVEPESEPDMKATPVQELAFEKEPIEPACVPPAEVCPSCGQKRVLGMLFCTGCGLQLTPPGPVEPVPEPIGTPLEELAVENEAVREPAPELEHSFVCVSCGATLIPNMKFCTICGSKATQPELSMEPAISVSEEMAMPFTELVFEKEPVQGSVPASEPRPSLVCISCGAALMPDMKFCTVCGAKTHQESAAPSPEPAVAPSTAPAFEQKPAPAPVSVFSPGRICPACGATLAPDATTCAACNDRSWREKWIQG